MNIILAIPFGNYQQKAGEVIKELQTGELAVCYISLNKPYRAVEYMLSEENIDPKSVIVVDAVTETVIPEPPDIPNVEYLANPLALRELKTLFLKMLGKRDIGAVVMDSLSTLLIYKSEREVLDFLDGFIKDFADADCVFVFTIFKEDFTPALEKSLSQLVDKVIDLSGRQKLVV